jgi:hypothetical protein
MVPISPADVAAYLTTNSSSPERWQPVVDHVTSGSDGPLARSLTTPLMAYLTRTAYREPSTDPASLLTIGSPQEIEAHLLSSYLPAVYGPRRWATVRHRYTTRQAYRWLTTIAALTRYTGFEVSSPTSSLAIFGRLVVSLLLSVLWMKWFVGTSADNTLGAVGLLVTILTLGEALFAGIKRGIGRGATLLVYLGMFAVVSFLWSWWLLLGWAVLAFLVLVLVKPMAWFETVVALLVTLGGLLAVYDGWPFVGIVVMSALLFTLLSHFSPWLVHLLQVVGGRLPLRINTFLRDAHACGVLRRSGDGYRLRHEQLRRYLA